MRRVIHLARDYAKRRSAFCRRLMEHPLHAKTLGKLEATYRGCLLFVLEVARLLGLVESGLNSPDEATLLRFLTPLVKLYTAKQCTQVISEGMELFGGLGYLEDSQIPTILRDAQVLSIWEGTTNVVSFDMLRVISHDKRAHRVALNAVRKQISHFDILMGRNLGPAFHPIFQAVSSGFSIWSMKLKLLSKKPDLIALQVREMAFQMSELYILSLIVRKCTQCDYANDLPLFQEWGRRVRLHFTSPLSSAETVRQLDIRLR